MFKNKLLAFNDIRMEDLDHKSYKNSQMIKKISDNDIAIIGINTRFPKANSFYEFWNNIKDGVDCIRKIPENRHKDIIDYFNHIGLNPDDIFFEEAAYLDEIDRFDYSFFKLSPKEASIMDPNQRLFLETAWGAIEDAGYGGEKLRGSKTGVYVGFSGDSEYKKLIKDIDNSSISSSVAGNIPSIIASRISYIMDLKGPSMLIDTACSSSLVAVHQACRAIRNGECELAIAGGVQIYVLPIRQAVLGIESSNYRTRAFDDSSDGTGSGEGVAVVLLKPLSKALKDCDNIYAVIKGSAVNQDGSSIGITAPNPKAQEEVIVAAWEDAGVDPETISYIETHGTGTNLGDPIEIEGISKAFKRYTDKKQFCAVGSVKTNIGHLDNSAGIAGLIKAVATLKYKMLPPNLHFNRPNRKINFEETAVFINDTLINWDVECNRRCGVSSFGLSGTNCHIILEEYNQEQISSTTSNEKLNVLTLSAKKLDSLKKLVREYAEILQTENEIPIRDICFTANTGRGHYGYRIAIVINSREELKEKIVYLNKINIEDFNYEGIYYGKHKVVLEGKELADGEITANEKEVFGEKTYLCIKEYLIENSKKIKILNEICENYVKGAYVNWELLYKDEVRKRVSLPTYQFSHDRCWVNIKTKLKTNARIEESLLHTVSWERRELDEHTGQVPDGYVLVFKDKCDRFGRDLEHLSQEGMNVIQVCIGDKFSRINNNSYIIKNCEEDYAMLFTEIDSKKIDSIFHMLTLDNKKEVESLDDLKEAQLRGVYSLFYLAKGLVKCIPKQKLSLIILSEYVNEVTGIEERICPEGATLFGLARTLKWEYPNILTKCIDIDSKTSFCEIMNEMMSQNREFLISIREGKRYVEVINELQNLPVRNVDFNIKENGVYIITGGLGRIGLELGKYLASRAKINLIMINRSRLSKTDSESILSSDKDQKRSIDIRGLEVIGANVECYSADITEEVEIKRVLDDAREKYGKINGIIHCAGIGVGVEGITIENDSEEVFRMVMKPKVEATWLLHNLTRNDNLDFFVMCSSSITLIGGIGGGSYTAANSYMDMFAFYSKKKGKNAISINWPTWERNELSKKNGQDRQLYKVISSKKAIELFDKIIDKDLNRIVIGELNIMSPIFKIIDNLPIQFSDKINYKIKNSCDASDNKGEQEAKDIKSTEKQKPNYSQIENGMTSVWKEVLGFKEIDIHDDFFDIGGDSILLSEVHTKIEKIYPDTVKIADLFTYSTISAITKFVDRKINGEEALKKKTSIQKPKESKLNVNSLLDLITRQEVTIDKALEIYKMAEEKHDE